MRWLLGLLWLLAALIGAPAAAQLQLPPRPSGPVHDGANILSPVDENLLSARLSDYNQRTGRALIVATVPSLQDDTIENYAVRLYENWGIGGAESDAGLLLLVAPNERKVRIEVGYGLHQYVTDILSGRIIRDQITPRFRENDYAGGINAGIEALITQLDKDPADAQAVAEAAAAAERQGGGGQASRAATFGGAIFWIVAILFFMTIFGRRGRRRRRRYGGGVGSTIGNIILWNAIGSAMSHGSRSSGWGGGGGGGWGGGGGGGFGGFGGGMSGGGGASGSW